MVNLAVRAGLDRLHAERHAEFVPDGLFGWACYLLLALFALALIARVQSRAAPTRAILTVTLSISPFVLALLWLAGDVPWLVDRPVMTTVLALVYLSILAVRVVGAAFGPVRARTAALAVALVLISPWALGVLNLDTRLWVQAETEEGPDEEDPAATEALFYEQPARIAAEVARVASSEGDRPQAYFLGFAGDGDPEVFGREAQLARRVFSARFGSDERSVLLINDASDRDTWPLASLSGLGQALRLLATRMDPQKDVLVLFLTSHGSEGGLDVSNGSLPLAPIEPTDLRRALDESGIQWRVVVVSACYAGVFIDALKSDTTTIMTAADAGHSSFGCEGESELTWFGEALLKDSLPSAASLEEAFAKAAQLIAQREKAEHRVHSNPQLYMGARMRQKLRELESARPRGERSSVTVMR